VTKSIQNDVTKRLPFLASRTRSNQSKLQMGLDMVTYLRTEWVSAALCTNQTPSDATSVLQLGIEDGRAINFVPRTVEELITSSASTDGKLSVSCKRQLKQQKDRRGTGIMVRYMDQRADKLSETEDESVDVVISLQAIDMMRENGLDWKKSLSESARVLKPGGRFLFVEKTDVEGENFLDTLMGLTDLESSKKAVVEKVEKDTEDTEDTEDAEEAEICPIFEMVGYDDVDLVIVPHVAGVVFKSENGGLTMAQIKKRSKNNKKEKRSEVSISVLERGVRRRRKKKKSKKDTDDNDPEK